MTLVPAILLFAAGVLSVQTVVTDAIEEQLERIQSSPHFSHSRRYPTFLSYVVHKTLKGQQIELKERTIGVEAFGRQPDYDLNADPIVRVTAGEVRKRLAQYYYEPEHRGELRIELHLGSYIPEFKRDPVHDSVQDPVASDDLEPLAPLPPFITHIEKWPNNDLRGGNPVPRSRSRKRTALFVVAVLAAVGVATAITQLYVPPFQQFWNPVINNPSPVLISVGSAVAMLTQEQQQQLGIDISSVGGHPLSSDPVAFADAMAMSDLQQVLSGRGKICSTQSSAQTTFSDLQKGPVILISAFNNPWTMRLTDPLRFHFVRSTQHTFEIQDRTDPVHKRWAVNTEAPFTSMNRDFGIVARFHDPTTREIIVVAAGIGENGTIAAGNVLTNREYLAEFRQQGLLPQSYQNWEAVIQTQIIDGKPGPPQVVASYTW
jgi:hypothetical protein